MIWGIFKRFQEAKDTDAKVDAILGDVSKTSQDTAASAKRLEDLLRANGVSLQIVVAVGGVHRKK